MKDYLLFVDTEATGLPKNWKLPYSKDDNWPHAVQISWVIFTAGGKEVKHEDFYVNNTDFTISPSAIKVHGINREFLSLHGKERRKALKKLSNDIEKFKPLILGHFIELDYHILNADFYRSKVPNRLKSSSSFCTMLATGHLVSNPSANYLRLGELYSYLFNKKLQGEHNALADARATAECFFELVKRGEITDAKILAQQKKQELSEPCRTSSDKFIPILIVILLILLIAFVYGQTISVS